MPHPRSNHRLGKGIPLKSQSKCILMNVYSKIIEENPIMGRAEIQARVANLWCVK